MAASVVNHFEVLRVTVDSTDGEVRAAYKEAVRRTHPDKGGVKENFCAVSEAFKILSSVTGRQSHAAVTRPFEAGTNVTFDSNI